MATDLSQELLRQVQGLSREEQLALLAELRKSVERPFPKGETRSILELRGLGKELWRSVDVDEYIRGERNSWGG